MSGPDRTRAEDICLAALERDEAGRAAFVTAECGVDAALQRQVEALLSHAPAAEHFLVEPIGGLAAKVFSGDGLVGREAGVYRIVSRLGAGGMGDVYRAHDARLGRDVAIKVLPPFFTADRERLARFEREARVLATLNHPHIGAIYGVEIIDGQPALVLELVEGETLEIRVRRQRLPIADALALARQMADALDAAHQKGIVHRDLKPANITITPAGVLKVLDFGLAKTLVAGDAPPGANPSNSPTFTLSGTQQGVLLGTAAYMSPEQARGQAVDKRADIWAFGCVVYETLTGRMAFPGSTVSDHIAAILEHEPDWAALPAATPASIRRLLRRCLDKDPARRLPDIAVARLEIDDAAGGAESEAPPPRDRRWRSAASAAAIATAAAIGIAVWFVTRPPPAAAPITFTLPAPEGQQYLTSYDSLSVSPDGGSVAFVAANVNRRFTDAPGGPVLYVRALGSPEARMMAGTDGASYLFWSPDSRFVGFVADGYLKKVAVTGGSPVTLAEHPTGRSAWSSQGVILYSRDDASGLYRIPETGGQPTRVTDLDLSRAESNHCEPWFLPDGRRFLFLGRSTDRSKTAIYLASLDLSARTHLIDVTSQPEYTSGFLLYQRSGVLIAQPFDEQRGRLNGDAVPIAEGVDSDTINGRAAFSASANGVLIYRKGTAVGGSGQLTWFDRGGKILSTVADNGFYRYPSVSPDGRHMMVTFSKDQAWMDLWRIDLDRRVPTRSTFHPDDDYWPNVWSRDGARVVFSSSRTRTGVYDLYQRSASGEATDELLWASGETKAASGLSPDGSLLLVDRNIGPGNGYDIWALPMAGDRKPFPVVATPFNETSGVFSPNGRFIAYASNESGVSQVYVQPFPPTGARVQLSNGNGFAPIWTSDGRTVLYSTVEEPMTRTFVAATAFMAVDVETSGPAVQAGSSRMLFTQRTIGGGLHAFAVDPSGQRFLLVVPEEKVSAPITVVVNWPSLLPKHQAP